MTVSLDDMIGLSAEQSARIAALAAHAEREAPAKLECLRAHFAATHDDDRRKLSYLFHNFRPQHEAERVAHLATLAEALEQTAGTGPWAVLFLYLGWVHLMVKRIERRQSGERPPAVSRAAFVYAMF